VTPDVAAENIADWLRRLGLEATVSGCEVRCSAVPRWAFAVGEASERGELDTGGLQLVVWSASTVRVQATPGPPLRFYERDHESLFWDDVAEYGKNADVRRKRRQAGPPTFRRGESPPSDGDVTPGPTVHPGAGCSRHEPSEGEWP
jgi:hypothetical protein